MREKITQKELTKLRASGRAVAIYPRKKVAVVDGWKYYILID